MSSNARALLTNHVEFLSIERELSRVLVPSYSQVLGLLLLVSNGAL